jgi:hypothetical protein
MDTAMVSGPVGTDPNNSMAMVLTPEASIKTPALVSGLVPVQGLMGPTDMEVLTFHVKKRYHSKILQQNTLLLHSFCQRHASADFCSLSSFSSIFSFYWP